MRASIAFVLAFQQPDVAVSEAAAGRELCRAHGDRFWARGSLVAVALAHVTAGRFAEAEEALDELRPLARSVGHPQLIADELARRVLVDRRFGRFDAVFAAAAEVDAVTDGFTDLNSRALVHAATAFIDVAQGRAEQALAGLERLFERYDVAGERVYLPSFALPMMEALIDLGRPSEAIDRFADGWSRWRRLVSWRLTMGPTLGLAHLCTGDVDDRSEHARRGARRRRAHRQRVRRCGRRARAGGDRAERGRVRLGRAPPPPGPGDPRRPGLPAARSRRARGAGRDRARPRTPAARRHPLRCGVDDPFAGPGGATGRPAGRLRGGPRPRSAPSSKRRTSPAAWEQGARLTLADVGRLRRAGARRARPTRRRAGRASPRPRPRWPSSSRSGHTNPEVAER